MKELLSPLGPVKEDHSVVYILVLWALATILFFLLKGCDSPKEQIESELKKGLADTVIVRTADTVWIEKHFAQVVRVPAEHITRFGADSSRFDTTVTRDSVTVRVAGTTFPAVDSLRLDLASIVHFPEVTKENNIYITRVDTLQIDRIIERATEVPWYDRFWVGAATTIALGVSIIIGVSQ